MQAAVWPGASATGTGSATRHSSTTSGQRGAKWQPDMLRNCRKLGIWSGMT
jgi:hypothetical protein